MRRPLSTFALLATVCATALSAGPAVAQAPGSGGRPAATVTITGLEQAIELLRSGSGQVMSRERAGLIAALSVLQLAGRQEAGGTAGAAPRSYRIETTNDGRVLVNGVDLSPLVRTFESQLPRP